MDLEHAAAAHSEWKVKFRTAIAKQESLDAATIGKDNCCELGVWLYGAGRSGYSQVPEFSDALGKHKIFHAEAGKIAQLINAKKYSEAEAQLNGAAYSHVSNEVITALRHLKQHVK